MLIASHRHKKEDLRLWDQLEKADHRVGQSASLRSKVEYAKQAIESFGGDCCSVSWGKDSLVVAHLTLQVNDSIPLVWVRWPKFDNPDCEAVRDQFAMQFSAANLVEVIGPANDDDAGRIGFAKANALWPRRICGIRKQESATRAMSRAVHGVSTELVCRPIIDWTTADVMGYLADNRLPVHPAYACLGGGRYDRDALRVDNIAGLRGNGHGRNEWEREYYGQELRRLECSSK